MEKIQLASPGSKGDSPLRTKKDLGIVEKAVNELIAEVTKLKKNQAALKSDLQSDVKLKVKDLNDKIERLDKALKYVNRRTNTNADKIEDHSHGIIAFFKRLFKRK